MDYTVFFGQQEVGKVQLLKEGLYTRVICRCQLQGTGIYRLAAQWGDHRENMGILAPMGDGFGLDRRIPCKRLGEGTPEFLLAPAHPQTQGKFVPIYPEEPFTYLENLKDAYMAKRDGQVGVVIPTL